MGCQWEFRPCGEGFIIETIYHRGWFVTVRDLKALHQSRSAHVVASAFPTCWDVEVLPVGPTDTELGDVFARYVWLIDLEGRGVVLRHEDADRT